MSFQHTPVVGELYIDRVSTDSLKLGQIEVVPLLDGFIRLDGGAMHGTIPRALWERKNPPDARNRILMSLRGLLVRGPGYTALVETGLGDHHDAVFADRFAVDRPTPIVARLAELGVLPADVDLVVDSHLHWDHAGGNVVRDGEVFRPAFPRAEYVVNRANYEEATHTHERNRASYRAEDFETIAAMRRFRFVEAARYQEVEVAPGLRVERVDGHADGMQVVYVDGGGQRVAFLTDMAPLASHLDLPWIMGYDLFPVDTLGAKKRLLPRAAKEGWIVALVHDPANALGRVRLDDRGRPSFLPLAG